MSDGYAIVRKSTLAWLLEKARIEDGLKDVPEEVVADLRAGVNDVEAPESVDPLRALGPVLAYEEHVRLLGEDEELGLPRGRDGEFWRVVAKVVWKMLANEGEAVLRLVSEKRS